MKIPDPEQARAIEDLSSNILLLASAGTGKTFTVARKVERVLQEKIAKPGEILLLTFTVKACGEMRDDLASCPGAAGVEIRTIHGFCLSLLAEEGKRTGAVPFAVCDEVDEEEILGKVFSEKIALLDMERIAKERYSLSLDEVLSRDPVWLAAGKHSGFYRRMDDGSYLGTEGVIGGEDARLVKPAAFPCPDCKTVQEGGTVCSACGFDFRSYIPPRKFELGKYGHYRDLVSLLKHERARVPKSGDEEKDYAEAFARLKERDAEGLKRVFTYRREGGDDNFDRVFYGKAERYIGALMHAYCAEMRKCGRLDFDDLVVGARDLLLDEEVCARVRKKYRFIVVDETQDTSALEYDVLKRLFPGALVMMCGDFFQTIYEWRGSRPFEIAEDFRKQFGAKTYALAENYRATRKLAAAAYGFLQKVCPADLLPPRFSVRSTEEGEPVRFVQCTGDGAEENFIFRYLLKHRGENVCVMARSNRYIERLFRRFTALNRALPPEEQLSFFAAGDFRLFKSAVAKDMLALFALLTGPDDGIAAERVAARYPRIGPATLAALRDGRKTGVSLPFLLASDREGDPLAPLLRAQEEGRLVVYDTETTGLDTEKDQVIQIAAVKLKKEGRAEFMRFVMPEREISEGALRTHGYSEEYLRAHGAVSQREALEEFSAFAEGCVLVGHNGKKFDRPLLDRSLRDCGLPPLPAEAEYDTLELSRMLLPDLPDHKLATLCGALGIVNERAHDAFEDVAATSGVLERLLSGFLRPSAGEDRPPLRKEARPSSRRPPYPCGNFADERHGQVFRPRRGGIFLLRPL